MKHRKHWTIAALFFASRLCAADCAPPVGFIDSPPPANAADQDLVSHLEQIDIDRSMREVLDAANRPLKDQIEQSSALPGVSGSYPLTPGPFGAVGSRRLNCLTDGSTLVEQVLVSDGQRFRYVVWNYTSEKARAVSYGVGEFVYASVSADRTHIDWTYSFQLNTRRFPGMLGGFGQFLFRKVFLEREYAAMMRGVLESIERRAESVPSDL
jgi:hypothetical protein